MKLGVKRGTVKLVDYDSNWSNEYLEEKSNLQEIFKSKCIQIEHIGSTAIPNLKSKPIIDIALKVQSVVKLKTEIEALVNSGYVERVGRLNGNQLVFAKGGDENVTHHLHIIEEDEPDWDAKLKFKNILLNNSDLVAEYNELKESLFLKYPNDRISYTNEKSTFIERSIK